MADAYPVDDRELDGGIVRGILVSCVRCGEEIEIDRREAYTPYPLCQECWTLAHSVERQMRAKVTK